MDSSSDQGDRECNRTNAASDLGVKPMPRQSEYRGVHLQEGGELRIRGRRRSAPYWAWMSKMAFRVIPTPAAQADRFCRRILPQDKVFRAMTLMAVPSGT